MLLNRMNWREARWLYEVPADNGGQEAAPPAETEGDEAYDKERAMATITKLRGFEKESKRLKEELEKRDKAETERKEKELSEVQRAEKRAQEAEDARKQLERRYRTNAIHSAVRLAAIAANFADPEDAVALADLAGVDVDASDQVVGAKEAVETLAKAKPHLIKNNKTPAPNINSTSNGAPQSLSPEALAEKKRASGNYVPF